MSPAKDLIALAIPFFIGSLLLEAWLGRKRQYYRFSDTLANLSCGTIQQLFDLLVVGVQALAYTWVFLACQSATFGSFFQSDTVAAWILSFLLIDLFYYFFHRLSHEVGFLWAAHVVHHQSEEYNLSVALRQSSFQGIFRSVFFLPLAALGIPLEKTLLCYAINLIYQFWIHTRWIQTLGPLEWILNTPSHHRVHHGQNPKYLDRNHAGVFIIWDRIFGTFQKEEEEPVYGVVSPFRSRNGLWANFHVWGSLLQSVRGSKDPWAWIKVLLCPPGWRPVDRGGPIVPTAAALKGFQKFEPQVSRTVMVYAAVQFVVLTGLALVELEQAKHMEPLWAWLLGLWLVWSFAAVGALWDRSGKLGLGEWLRWGVLVMGLVGYWYLG